MEEKNKNLVFVYGSLCSGLQNNGILRNNNAKYLSIAKTVQRYDMYDLGYFPGIIESDKGKFILGELYVVSDELLKRLDVLEGCPHFYQRKLVDVVFGDKEYPVAAYIYVLAKGSLNALDLKIPANDWRSYYFDKVDKIKADVMR